MSEYTTLDVITKMLNDGATIHRIVLSVRGEQPRTLKIWIEFALEQILRNNKNGNRYLITQEQFSALLPYLRTYNDGADNNLLYTDEAIKQMHRFVIDRNLTDELLALVNDLPVNAHPPTVDTLTVSWVPGDPLPPYTVITREMHEDDADPEGNSENS